MAFAACVTYEVHPGHGEELEAIFAALRERTLAEPGCLAYEPHRDPDDPTRYFLYEAYADEAAYREHQASEHFARYVREGMAEHVAGRDVRRYEPLAADPFAR